MIPYQGQGNWYKMVEVNGSYENGRNERIWLRSLHLISNTKVFAMQDQQMGRHANGQTDGQWPHVAGHLTSDYIDPDISKKSNSLYQKLQTKSRSLTAISRHGMDYVFLLRKGRKQFSLSNKISLSLSLQILFLSFYFAHTFAKTKNRHLIQAQ